MSPLLALCTSLALTQFSDENRPLILQEPDAPKAAPRQTYLPGDVPSDPLHSAPPTLVTGFGVSVEAGGGFGSFLGNLVETTTSAAGVWQLRVSVGTRRHWAFEASYVGNAQSVNILGVEPNARLLGNGVETAARFNLLTGMWQPYASVGVGLMHYTFGGALIETADVAHDGVVGEVPIAVGMAIRLFGAVIDTRVAMHPATSAAVLGGANASRWDVAARAGFEF